MSLPNRRRNYFVDKRLQGLLALLNLGIAGVVTLFVGLEIIRSFYVEFGWPGANRPFTLHDFIFILKLVVLAIIGGGFFWLISAFSAHRIAGPVYKINKGLKEIANGNYGARIQFRKNDFFHDVAKSFNEMAEVLEKKLSPRTTENHRCKPME